MKFYRAMISLKSKQTGIWSYSDEYFEREGFDTFDEAFVWCCSILSDNDTKYVSSISIHQY